MLVTKQDGNTNDEVSQMGDSICSLVTSARQGCARSQSELVGQLRSYMAIVASQKMNPAFQAKFGESDIVQQSIAVAIEKFDGFRGSTEGELFAWVRTILQNQLLQNQRALLTDKRNMFREQQLESPSSPAHSPPAFVDHFATPGTQAIRHEHTATVQSAMKKLSEEYRTVIELRNWEQLSFPEIGKRMNRSANAVTKLWYRALIELRKQFGQLEESDEEL